ncbi:MULTISPECIES: hypothetical protein [Cetobacterium]|jgi:hypothetical protein|uniref:Uncharacterized protein n=1 Tax=Candidatus Cetobacterium colombiensis TaxID=3073100 RepID=A0ABU4WCL2_9FUSO|nr:hypothetical protein [Candidatus Cetobacterium colombiensis]MDX8336964.1 hypothetical protein [Candidatus Cetobacterium colombiensis]
MAKVKNIIVAHAAQMSQQVGGAVDIFGSFDNIIQPLFPHPMMRLSIVLTFEEVTKPTVFEVRLNGPDDDLISRGELTPMVDPLGVGKKIIDIDRFLVKTRGKYTIDIFEKEGEELKFLKTETLFIAEYPPQRRFTPEQVEEISKNDELIRSVKTEFKPFGFENPIKLQHSLLKDSPVEDGFVGIPEDDRLEIDGQIIELTGVRRQIEWMFGNPIPKEESTEEQTTDSITTEDK